ncbi:MAG TPA: hypothetical protein VM733_21240, partial [Thermoanaerobaculia bacterium]|nr:hypothetical protein [Thermoanaerobaculia bacterium]
MAGKYCFSAVVAYVLLFVQVAPAEVLSRGSFTVETKANAAEQFAYATSLSREPDRATEPLVNAMKVAAALEIIPNRWPGDRALSIRAYR